MNPLALEILKSTGTQHQRVMRLVSIGRQISSLTTGELMTCAWSTLKAFEAEQDRRREAYRQHRTGEIEQEQFRKRLRAAKLIADHVLDGRRAHERVSGFGPDGESAMFTGPSVEDHQRGRQSCA